MDIMLLSLTSTVGGHQSLSQYARLVVIKVSAQHNNEHTHTHATAFAPVPGGSRRWHELVVGPGRREQVEGNVVRHSRLEECDEQLYF